MHHYAWVLLDWLFGGVSVGGSVSTDPVGIVDWTFAPSLTCRPDVLPSLTVSAQMRPAITATITVR